MYVNERDGQVAACFSGMLVGPIYAYMHMYNRTNKSTKVWSKLWEMNRMGTVKPIYCSLTLWTLILKTVKCRCICMTLLYSFLLPMMHNCRTRKLGRDAKHLKYPVMNKMKRSSSRVRSYSYSSISVLNLWVATPLGFAYQTSTLQFTKVAKLQLGGSNETILWLRITTTWGTVLKDGGVWNIENHCASERVTRYLSFISGCGKTPWQKQLTIPDCSSPLLGRSRFQEPRLESHIVVIVVSCELIHKC